MADDVEDAPANEERLRAAIGPRADYYLRHWRAMDEKGKSYDWNWAACFANGYWLIFRKMWLGLVLFILANIAVSLLGMAIPALNKYTFVLMILLTFVTGSYGNRLYRRQIDKLVASGAPLEQLQRRGRHLAARFDHRPGAQHRFGGGGGQADAPANPGPARRPLALPLSAPYRRPAPPAPDQIPEPRASVGE